MGFQKKSNFIHISSIFQNVVNDQSDQSSHLVNPVGFVNPVGLINVENCKLSRSTNLALNFPKILNRTNIFQTPNHILVSPSSVLSTLI